MLACPVCRSTTIYPVVGGYIGQIYRCKACGYRGSFVLTIDDEPGEKPLDLDENVREGE